MFILKVMRVEVATMDLYGTPFLGSWPTRPLSLKEIQDCFGKKKQSPLKRARLKKSQPEMENGIIAMIKSFYFLLAKSTA